MWSQNKDDRVAARTLAMVFLALFASLLLFTAVGCGPSGATNDTGGPESGMPDEEGLRLITRPEANYSIDDLTAAGFKKSKQFELDTVPGATDIWYGFFKQKDIEVRFYESHSAALELGVPLAEEVIGKTAGQRDYLIPVVNLYPAYAVVGNAIMLCERQLATCQALIDVLK